MRAAVARATDARLRVRPASVHSQGLSARLHPAVGARAMGCCFSANEVSGACVRVRVRPWAAGGCSALALVCIAHGPGADCAR